MKVIITGGNGFLGRRIRIGMSADKSFNGEIIGVSRDQFQDDRLREALDDASTVIHCAGINRGDETVVDSGNAEIADRLVEVLTDLDTKPHLVYTNTIQRDRDSPYGRGKRTANDIFERWAAIAGARYTEVVLPHIFGEGGKPFYNSAVQTFCYQISAGEPISVDDAGVVELIHVQKVVEGIMDIIHQQAQGEIILPGTVISVPDVANTLIGMHRDYESGIIPDVREPLKLQLFNTLRHFMYPSFYPRAIHTHSDDRGVLFECVKSLNGGQTFVSTTKPGVTRGNHYHFRKIERFLVVSGEAIIRIRSLLDDQINEFQVNGAEPAFVDMPTVHTHSITNTGNTDLLTLFWSHELYDAGDPDTYPEPVFNDED